LIPANVIHDTIHVLEAWIQHQNNHVTNYVLREGFYKTQKKTQHINEFNNHFII
jgi:hypothetical protein